MIFLLLALAQWVAVPANSYQYFKYGGENGAAKSIERAGFDNHRTAVYSFPDPPARARTVCAVENRPGVYWFTPDGHSLDHRFPTPNPSEFNVSALETGIHGFGITAAFSGSARRIGAVETAYFADRACSDGSVEYGFSRDLATDSVLVYWSTFANCANDAASLCRKTDDAALGANYSNVQQENSAAKVDHGFRIYGLKLDATYTFKMFVNKGGFRVEVSRGGRVTNCSESDGAALKTCEFEKSVAPWFPLQRIDRGYIITGTQRAGDPGIAAGSVFRVSAIVVAK